MKTLRGESYVLILTAFRPALHPSSETG